MSLRLFFLASLFFSLSISASAIPPDLAEWQEWVQYEQEYRTCPTLNGGSLNSQNLKKKSSYLCAWPGKLVLSADEQGARFTQIWNIIDESKVPLPGNKQYWPQQVLVNQTKAIVLEDKNQPYILLPKGEYTIAGVFNWQKRPESLLIPKQIGLVDLTVNGKKQDFIKREKSRVWLGDVEKVEQKEKDFLKIWVNRLIRDSHPMRMTMAIELDIGGRAREQKLTRIDLEDYQLMFIDSELNTWIDSQGDIWVQLKPGSYELRFEFKVHGFPQKFKFSETGESWPQQEIWIYQSNERLRSTLIEGASPIDSDQGFVKEWQGLPHYILDHGGTFKINERHRGISHSADSLSLERNMWLSFDNKTYYFFDTILGQKSKDWRVSTIDNYRLSQLSNHGEERLITYDDKQRTGAEVRTPQISIYAGGEVEAKNMQHASGWDINFATTRINLNIPPGRKLITIGGADNSYGDWISDWDLIDLFFVLITLALVFKLFGWMPSVFALVVLILGYHESNMPTFLWFNLIAALGLVTKITNQKLLKYFNIYKWISVSMLLIVLLPFLADQIRFTLYPQLEMERSLTSGSYGTTFGFMSGSDLSEVYEEESPQSIAPMASLKKSRAPRNPQSIVITGSGIKHSDLDNTYEQGAIIQAGKGKPNWGWQKAQYSWNGPVDGSEKVKITILSSSWVRVLRVTLILFSVLWLLAIFNKSMGLGNKLKKLVQTQAKSSTAASVIFLLVGLSPFIQSVEASEYPSERLLNELQERLYPTPECSPDCVTLTQAKMRVKNKSLTLNLNYQSGTDIAALIPTSADWRINDLQLNGKKVKNIWRNQTGSWVSLSKGQSNLVIHATLKDKSELTIKFPERPKIFNFLTEGWDISGVNLQKLVSDSVQLTRIAKPKVKTENEDKNILATTAQEQSIEDLYLVVRHFSFASQWRLSTEVIRQAPIKGVLTAKVPLLSFEKPLQMTENVKDGLMHLVMPSNSSRISWESSISGDATFELTALSQSSASESWEILVYPNWNINIDGIPAVKPNNLSHDEFWVYQYFPRGGEKLSFSLTKPPSAQGASVAITKVKQNHQLSKRKTATELVIDYRATRAEPLLIEIGDAELKDIMHDADQVNLGKVDGAISIGLKPGEHQLKLRLESQSPIEFKVDVNQIKLNQEFTNSSIRIDLPNNRWLIAAKGPGYGPAILYWGELIFFMLLAIGLSRLPFSPLRYWQWLVLGLGMSTFSWPALALVIAWILGSQWKRENQSTSQAFPITTSWITLFSTIVAVLTLVTAVPFGLLQSPDMGVVGNGSYGNSLLWFLDQGDGELGSVSVYTLPLWVYKILMLLWSTWLSFSLIRWIGWTWNDLSTAQFFKKKEIISKLTSDKKE